jgi:cell fate regulator YaaT (PSP1 superfamily)
MNRLDLQGFAPDRAMDNNSEAAMLRAHDTATAHDIPMMYRVPLVELQEHERREIEARRDQQHPTAPPMNWTQGAGRPRKQLYLVSFKCSRVDVFYLLDNTGLHVREGDLVIVEADRGQDLGTVQHARVTPEAARILKKKYSEEQYKWLMMYSRNKDGGVNPNAQLHGEQPSGGQLFPDAPSTMQGTIPRENFSNLKPKAIKRLANDHEIKMLAEKEGNEAKAKRTCQQKVAHLRLQMEILDAEWQWDFQKLIFYYYADHYINFKDLITELYRIYKTRIWLSAINPASFSQHAMGQPPSGIGPGAVPPYNPYALNNAYTMSYGEDRDPYGAQMPYRIPYETYTPNYPQIPGVANSFAQPPYGAGQGYAFNDSMSSPPMGGSAYGTQDGAEGSTLRGGTLPAYNLFNGRAGGDSDHGHLSERNAGPQFMSPQHVDRSSAMLPSFDYNNRFEPNQASQGPWNPATQHASNALDGSRTAQLPAPIGTRRPSHGDDLLFGSQRPAGLQQSQQAHLSDRFSFGRQGSLSGGASLNKTANNPEDTPRQRESIDESAPRVRPVDRFFGSLPQGEGMMKER